jgi:hypothetical protein
MWLIRANIVIVIQYVWWLNLIQVEDWFIALLLLNEHSGSDTQNEIIFVTGS